MFKIIVRIYLEKGAYVHHGELIKLIYIYIYKKTRFSKAKSIDVHCHGGDKKARSETFVKK